MTFIYSEEENNYFLGAVQGILYYKRLHNLGFTLEKDSVYYVDFSGYNASMNAYEDFVYSDIVYSVCSPLMGRDGDVCYSGSLSQKGLDFYKEKKILAEDSEECEGDEYESQGIYIHLDHPFILEYLENHKEDLSFLLKILDSFKETEEYAVDIEEFHLAPNSYNVDEHGIYLYLNIYAAYYMEYFTWFIFQLATEIASNKCLKKEE